MSESIDIQGYDGLYSITATGEVFSHKTNKYIKQDCARGYMQVTLYKSGKPYRYKVHRLVAEAFVPNPNKLPFVNHKDENKQNNRFENLEWCTAEYNNKYGSRGERSKDTQIKNAESLGRTKRVECIDTGIQYASTKEAERHTGIYHSHISRCCNGKRCKAGGLRWKYA